MNKVIALLLGSAALVSAHLDTPTTPKAGATYAPGSTVNVQWKVSVAHDLQDLSYSTNGTTWTSITTGLAKSQASYSWTVPAMPSTTVRFRVCQRDGGGGCTNAHNTSAPGTAKPLSGGGSVYVAITGNFTIAAATGVNPAKPGVSGASIRLNAATRFVDVAVPMEKAGRVKLEAFDAQGKLVATLVDEVKAEGLHEFSVFSNALDASRITVFRLQAGTQVIRHSVEPTR